MRGALSLRRARDADAQDLFGLLALCFAEYPGCFVDPHADLADLRRPGTAFAGPGEGFWVLPDEAGRVAGCVALGRAAPGTAELHRLYVRPDRRGVGIGAALVAQAEAKAVAAGAGGIVLWSDTRFADGHRLYRRLGYRATGAERDLGDISRSREACFEKLIGPAPVPEPAG